ncbi:MAG: hypothetical protein GAK30_00923 [Paracidovorax wautersii]|uniref:DUF4148 domain-containing protein n=1 Tax=Paracidovorax wautersii TaxID=1177982 RepID=A0A7V8JR68_9BURK|nr:MAG: hypothetical protein GAK30_00923 [Paracidovorax wautersii]
MNKKLALILSAAALASSSAFAFQTAEDPAPISTQAFDGAPVTGAQVIAERAQYVQQLRSRPSYAQDASFVATDNTAQPVARSDVQAGLQSLQQKRAAGPARAEDGMPG